MLMSLVPALNVFAGSETITVEFEDQLANNTDFSLTEKDGGVKMAGISKISTSSYSYTVTFNASEEGEYIMQLAAAAYAEGMFEGYSDVSWSLNGSEPLSLNESCDKITAGDTSAPNRTIYTSAEKQELNAGENTLTLSGGKKTGGLPMVEFYLDYVSFMTEQEEEPPTPTTDPGEQPVPTPGPDGKVRMEIEDVSDECIVDDANVSGGKFQTYKAANRTEDLIQRFEGAVDKDGEYTFSFACADYANMEFLSQLYFSINGGEYVEINGSSCVSSRLDALADTSQQETFGLYKYTYTTPVPLTAGTFTVDIKAVKRLNISAGEGIYFAFDYIEAEEAKEPEPVIGNGRVEVEDITTTNIVNDANVSGGRYQAYKSTDTSDVVQEFNFNIETSGDYTVSVAAGTFAMMPYLSPLYISINDGRYIELTEENFYISQLKELADTSISATFNLYNYVYKTDLSLDEGVTNVKVKATARTNTAAPPGVYYSLDYVEVLPVKQLDGLYGVIDKGCVVRGTGEQLRIFNSEDRELTEADISSVKYTVEDENIASVDETGIVFGRNPGETVIRADIDRKGVKATMEYTVHVTDESCVYLTNAKRSGSEISVTVNAAADYTPSHSLLICVYGEEDGYLTSLKNVYTAELEDVNAGGTFEIIQSVEAGADDKIGIYLIDGSFKAAYGKIML